MIAISEPIFTHCPRCGANGLKRPGPAAYQCQACSFFYHINPAIGVGGFVLNPDGRMILLRRANDPGKGLLGLPGGFVDAGETAEAALQRELKEEINLEIDNLRYLTSAPNRYPYRGVIYNVLDVFYVCRTESFAGVDARHEVDEICFSLPSAIDPRQIAFPSVRAALQEFLKEERKGRP